MADLGNHAIRRIDLAMGLVTTIVGDGTPGDVDAPVGLDARLDGPVALATDGATLWISEQGNAKIKAVDLAPPFAVTTVAGGGPGPFTPGSGPAARFDNLRGLAYYAGHLYVVDGNAGVLCRVDPVSGDVLAVAGAPYVVGSADGFGSMALFTSPRYIASDNSGMLFLIETNGAKVRSYNVATTAVDTFAGNGMSGYADGVGTSARIHRPRGVTSDGTSLYFSEFNQHTLRQAVLASAEVSTLVGQHCGGAVSCAGGYLEGVGTGALLNGPGEVVFHYPSSSLFFWDTLDNVIRRIQ